MRALVTGSDGFIGRHVSRTLAEHDYDIWACDLNHTMALEPDCRSMHSWARRSFSFDLVVHCAAVVGGRTMIEGSPLELAANDLAIDASFMLWALKARPARVVLWSSSAAYPIELQGADHPVYSYGSPKGHTPVPNSYRLREAEINLNAPQLPDETYGWVKLTLERTAQLLNEQGIPTHVFRPFSGYGEDQALDYPFPSFIDRAVRRCDPFDVWGDGEQVRDFVHVDDIMRVMMAAIDNDVRGPLNICTGRPTSFLELARLVSERSGHVARLCTLDEQPVGVRYRVGDPDAMSRLVDVASFVTLEEGIDRALAARS